MHFLKNKKISTFLKGSIIFLFVFFFWSILYAAETYIPGETITLGEFIYEDDYTPTTDDCTVSVFSPAGATLVNEVTMSDDATGWHYYSYITPLVAGKYPAFITCGAAITGDLLKIDKSFILVTPVVTDASIASSVWSSGVRTLTSFGTLVSDIATAVWGSGTRTLTAFGSLAADVWNDTFAGTRQLTTKNISGGGSLATESYIDASEATVITEIETNRTLINALNNISAADVWAHGTRSINSGSVTIDSASVDSIWDTASSGLAASGSIGKQIADNLDAQISTRGTSTLTAGDVWSAATRTLSTTGVDDVSAGVWANATRTLSNYGNDITAADVWNILASSLTASGSIGEQLSLNIDGPISDVLTEVQTNNTLINALNNISAADVWAHGTRSINSGSVTIDSASVDSIWDTASSGLAASGSIGKQIADNLDAQISTRGTSNISAADVWNSATRTLSDYSTSTIASAVWANGARTLSNYGNDITAADVWNTLSSSLTTVGSIGEQLKTNADIKNSDILAEVQNNTTLINALNNISATDVWSEAGRSLDAPVDLSTASTEQIWDIASIDLSTAGSIGKRLVDNIDAQISTRGTSTLTAADVWNAGTRTLSDYSESTVATAVWANATRTLSNYGNDITAADVWNVLASSLTIVGSIGEQVATNLDAPVSGVAGGWSVKMGNVERIQAGYVYRTKIFILDSTATPTAPFSAPTVTLYDADRNIVVNGVATTLISTGVYEYTYTLNNNAAQGLWETVASTQVENGKTIQTNDYWEVAGSPAQVLVNSVTAPTLNSILGNVTITNEGLSGYEYQYEWCIVTDVNNVCGGNDDAYYATAAKFINPSEDWNTNLSASVATAGTYYFKLVVYFGTESSGASRVFTVTAPGGGGGGGGGGGPAPAPVQVGGSCNGSDFNKDTMVNSIDFSILLYFWKTIFPFANPCVDVNLDKKVDSIDFSIMLFKWGKKII